MNKINTLYDYFKQNSADELNEGGYQCSSGHIVHRWLFLFTSLVMLFLAEVPAQAFNYSFGNIASDSLPAGCSGSSGVYSCTGAIALADGDTISVVSPSKITFSAAFATTANNKINANGSASDLTLVVVGAFAPGPTSVINANIYSDAAVAIAPDCTINGSISTTAGAISVGVRSIINGPISSLNAAIAIAAGAQVIGDLTTSSGAISVGDGGIITGSIRTIVAGAIALDANAKVIGNLSTASDAIAIGANAKVTGMIDISGVGALTIGAGAEVVGNSTVAYGAISVDAGAHITGNLATLEGAVNIGADSTIDGSASTTVAGAVNVGAGAKVTVQIYTVKNDAISLGAGAIIASVCCRVTNNANCVINGTGLPMPPTCNAPIADYRLDECSWNGSLGEVKDSSGNNINGTSKNLAYIDIGRLNNGGHFIASKNQNINIPSNNLLKITNAITFTTWIKRDSIDNRLQNIYTNGRWDNALRIQTDNKILFSLNLAGKTVYLYSTSTITDTNWHHITGTYDGATMKIYIDNNAKGSKIICELDDLLSLLLNPTSTCAKIKTDVYYSIGSESSNAYYFNGSIDEMKIYNRGLSASDITAIYTNELAGKNYNGTSRATTQCSVVPSPILSPSSTFDAWDSFRSISDRNISTKIVNKPFTFTIASLNSTNSALQDFNGTVCSQIVNENNVSVSNWNKTQLTNQSSSLANFTVSRAVGGNSYARVLLKWKKNVDTSCPLVGEDNTTLASDNFAIRPAAFTVTAPNAVAGINFDINFTAPIYGGSTASSDYNESSEGSFDVTIAEHNASCVKGEFSPTPNTPTNFSFVNGSKIITTQYSEVGALDLNISELKKPCSSRFAHVDCDDANVTNYWNTDTNLSIEGNLTSISITPHHFDVNATLSNAGNGFTYLSNDLNMSAKLSVSVTAKNDQNVTTKNYNSGCYANDTNYTIHYTTSPSAATNLNYFETNTSKSDSNLTATSFVINSVPKTIFSSTDINGTAKLNILVDFNRSNSSPVNPFDLNITSVNVNDTDIKGAGSPTNTAKFVYGRIRAYDIQTSQNTSVPNPVEIEIYGKNSTDTFLGSKPQSVLYWYRNTDHNTTFVGNVINGGFSAGENNGSISPSTTITNGTQDVTVTSSITQTVHLNINPWLWYSPNSYSFAFSSKCSQHPCFQYQYITPPTGSDTLIDKTKGVNSGTFTGSDFEIAPAKNATRRGVKLFR